MPENKALSLRFLYIFTIILTFLFSGNGILSAQENGNGQNDTIIIESGQSVVKPDTSSRDPKRAMMLSLVPGLGQIYNKKVWKVPIIYAGFGTFAYFIDRNQRYYMDLKSKLMNPDTYNLKYFDGTYTTEQLTNGKDMYKRWRDLSIIGTAGLYVLQIIDASVDAYMFDWDVSDELTLHIEPAEISTPGLVTNAFGLSASIRF